MGQENTNSARQDVERLMEDGFAGRLDPGTEAFERFVDLSARRPSGHQMTAHYRNPEEHRASFEIALGALSLRPEDRYLEIGFGGGQLLEMALDTVGSAAGIDHSPDMLALASERNTASIVAGRLQLVYGDVERLPWTDDEFSCAASVNMFFFLESPQACLRELRRVLRPHGRLVIVSVPFSEDPAAGGPWGPALRTYRPSTLETMLRAAGFREATVEERPGAPQVTLATV